MESSAEFERRVLAKVEEIHQKVEALGFESKRLNNEPLEDWRKRVQDAYRAISEVQDVQVRIRYPAQLVIQIAPRIPLNEIRVYMEAKAITHDQLPIFGTDEAFREDKPCEAARE